MIIRATSTTMGQSSPDSLTLSKPYRWHQIPDWKPNDPRYKETVKPPLTSGSAPGSSLREVRIASFGEALRDLGYQNPRNASTAAVIEAGKRVGVGEKTARRYRAALLKQREAAS